MRIRSYFLAGAALMLILFLSACALPPQAKYLHPEFGRDQIHTVAVLPVIDARLDQTEQIDLSEYFILPLREALEKKGYRVMISSPATPLSPSVTDAQLASLVPDGTDAMIALFLKDFRSDWQWKLILATYEFQAQLEGKLISKPRGVVWYHTETTTHRAGGLLDALLTQALAPKQGSKTCVHNLLATLPDAHSASSSEARP
ncbi:MAG: hypothetical protein JW395_3018 [Nitrospira sp.]|nr:hypothetical protein [Nitrospira sp.]